MMRQNLFLVLCLAALPCAPAAAVSLASLDSFDTDNEGWRVGAAGVAPSFQSGNSFNGQPGFLSHFSDNSGPNGKWLMWTEESDWTGDYLNAGVAGVSLWVDSLSGADTIMWLGFDGPGGWFFTPGQQVVTADDWKRFEFDITESSLIHQGASGGSGVYQDTLGAVTRFEVFAGPGPVSFASRGDILQGGVSENVILIDSIAAQPIPEPASVLLVGLAVAGITARRRAR